MNQPASLTLKQTLEAMPLVFNPQAIPGLTAEIQFNISGAEPGVYTLQIANNACVFQTGGSSKPTLTINTPSEIWLGISRGEINGQEALMKGLYTVQGDFSLLSKWGALFQRGASIDMHGPVGQRLAGPLAERYSRSFVALTTIMFFIFVPRLEAWREAAQGV